MYVSPALERLLDGPGGTLLKGRFPYEVKGVIGDDGLVGPGEYTYYAGSATLGAGDSSRRGDSFGYAASRERPLGGFLLLIVVITCVVLLLPVLVFVATAVRFGGEQRDRRLAALRLIGADNAMTRRTAAGEALAGSLFGLAAGAVFFLLLRVALGRATVWNVNVFPSDMVPEWWLVALIVLVVPLSAVAVTMVALRGISIEPLGVVREATPRPRRIWWRLALIAAGLALLLPLTGKVQFSDTEIDTVPIAAGAVLALIGVTTLLPWLVETVVRRLRGGGPVSWQLASRRLQLSSGSSARAVSGIVVAAAGAIALQMMFQAMQYDFMRPTNEDTARAQLEARLPARTGGEAREMIERFSATRGVDGVIGLIESGAVSTGPAKKGDSFGAMTALTVGDCRSLSELAKLPSCRDGDVFIALTHGDGPSDSYVRETARPGAVVDVRDDLRDPGAARVLWRIPASAREVSSRLDPLGGEQFGILATPSAIDARTLGSAVAHAMIRVDPDEPDAAEYVRNTAALIDPTTRVDTLKNYERDAQYASVRQGITVAASATMALIAVSLLVAQLEQLRDRKRLLSALVAFGTRRSTLGWSVLWQTAVPIGLGLALAVAGGLGLGLVLLRLVDKSVEDWWVFLPVAGVGGALIVAVTLASLPLLWRVMRPDGLRTE
ncbi:ABC transporter permease [Streptomyces sp. NPDC001941]|uniref:ABC transporter permease n=1 Tax=Streptomyces sp. NPDC001941 TaxID=3154659 RepID=UPI0033295C49